MILRLDDWVFDVDMACTMEYSAAEAAEHCECAYCRNFYAAIDSNCTGLRSLLAQFGINVEAPEELYPYDLQGNRIWYEGEYVVFGSILQHGKKPITGSDNRNFLIWPRRESEYAHTKQHFVLSLEDVQLPWILDEPMEDVLSPANEPSFLKKMWTRLLDKLKPDTVHS